MAFMKLSVIILNSVISLIVFLLSDSFDYTEGHTGVGLWHGSRTAKIEDHGHKKFVFLNHDNKKAIYSF